MDDKQVYPSNSRSSRVTTRESFDQQEQPPVKRQKLITGNVKTQKPGFAKRLGETFLEDNTRSVGGYIFHDVLIPAAKSLVCDIVGWGGFAEMLLFGGQSYGRRNGRGSSLGGNSRVNYNSISSRNDRDRDRDRPRNREMSRSARASHNFNEIILDNRGEANDVLSNLVDLTIDYHQATVADLYGFLGMDAVYTDETYGWDDLSSAKVRPVRGGYLLDLPRPMSLT